MLYSSDFDVCRSPINLHLHSNWKVQTSKKEDTEMGKVQSSCYAVCLFSSILVNIFFLANLYVGGKWKVYELSWSKTAAEEAEIVASVECSGHGRAYLDGVVVYGKPVCECNTCFRGHDCSEFIPHCPADADSGDPVFLEPFWMQHAASSALLVPGWHRMSYSFADHTYVSKELENHIRKLHAIAKNAVTDGRYILFGAGSTQLLNAAVFALSPDNSSYPARVVAATPYYAAYKLQTDYFRTVHFEFYGDALLLKNNSRAMNVIEFVTSPNNPDGQLRKPVLQGPSVRTINDHAYYWPHFTAIPAPADENVMIFTTSKLTGHAGSRFGWAIVKDKNVYERMSAYIDTAVMGISRDTQLRALKLLKVIVKDNGKEIFEFGFKTMQNRWEKLNQIISLSKRFSLQEISPQYCSFLNKVRGPSPAYAWLKCEREEDTDCATVLRAENIIGREGTVFNATGHFVRLSLLKSQDDFELLLHRLMELVSREDGAETM